MICPELDRCYSSFAMSKNEPFRSNSQSKATTSPDKTCFFSDTREKVFSLLRLHFYFKGPSKFTPFPSRSPFLLLAIDLVVFFFLQTLSFDSSELSALPLALSGFRLVYRRTRTLWVFLAPVRVALRLRRSQDRSNRIQIFDFFWNYLLLSKTFLAQFFSILMQSIAIQTWLQLCIRVVLILYLKYSSYNVCS